VLKRQIQKLHWIHKVASGPWMPIFAYELPATRMQMSESDH
jgi:hypothetical protein